MPGDKPPFDPVKASFWLIAGILAVHCIVVLVGVGYCVYWGEHIVTGHYKCDNINASLSELLTNALAAGLAFSAGNARKDK